ncbi:tyrosine-type recombinase/integrase [Rhizobium leguminosarum]|uniref:tyrosine-type recombinase/integrase n=1 Tax=Rhizobium leguminosarum TaxID=384 RepID=UPI0013EEB9D7|nr:integrase family protein [Rhizobium leguminosarum]
MKMNRQHLTDDLIAELPLAHRADDRYEIYDASVENLAVRIGSKSKSFSLTARFGGPDTDTSRRMIGKFPEMKVEAARAIAHTWNRKVKDGVDPAIEVAEAIRVETIRLRSTFASVMTDYLAQLPKRKNKLRVKDDIAFYRRHFLNPATNPWVEKPISMVTDADIEKLIENLKSRAPTQAFHALGKIKRFFRWAMKPSIRNEIGLAYSPADQLNAYDLGLVVKARDRVFEYEEARAYLLATNAFPYPYGPCLRVLFETGQRIGVVSATRWSQLNLERRLWIIPGTRRKDAIAGRTSKNDGSHKVPLSERVVRILLEIKETLSPDHGDFVFSFSNGKTPVGNFSNLKERRSDESPDGKSEEATEADSDLSRGRFERLMREYLENAGLEYEPWVWHDVRRTVRTGLEPICGKEVAEAAVGHGQTGIARVYNLHRYRAQIRRAFAMWSDLLDKVENGTCTIGDWEHDPEAMRESAE